MRIQTHHLMWFPGVFLPRSGADDRPWFQQDVNPQFCIYFDPGGGAQLGPVPPQGVWVNPELLWKSACSTMGADKPEAGSRRATGRTAPLLRARAKVPYSRDARRRNLHKRPRR